MKKIALQPAELFWQDKVPFASEFDDSYFSQQDGLNETRYNFLQHNFLAQRFADLNRGLPNKVFRIAESGFGSGLNFLAAVQLWQQIWQGKAPVGELHFISFEKYPMRLQDLCRVHQTFPEIAEQSALLQAIYPPLLPGWHDLYLPELNIRLSLWFGDIQEGFKECDSSPMGAVDAWFLDGFAPSKNPQMWQASLFQNMARLSHAGTTFATFTAAGIVRRGLQEVGFEVSKDKGFGRKREMCYGKMAHKRPVSSKAPWFERPEQQNLPQVKTAIVVGAGLAGATTAYALAEKGVKVTVLEKACAVATQASGNLAGTLHPLITADWNLRSRWYWAGYQSAMRWLKPWLLQGKVQGDLKGLIQLATDDKLHAHWLQSKERVGVPEEVARWVDEREAAELVGMNRASPGILYADSGWIYPKSVVETCLAHPNITLELNKQVDEWDYQQGLWQVSVGAELYQADALVFATASLDQTLNSVLQAPLRPVKGQVTHLQDSDTQKPLQMAVTHGGYSSPTASGQWVSGATFEAPDMGTELSLAGHRHNLQAAEEALPDWLLVAAAEFAHTENGRIAFRPTTPDHLPIVGPVADWDFMQQAYLAQSHTKALFQYPRQAYLPHLYISNGHGARGMISVFLAAEMICAEIFGQALPLAQSLYQASHPARFQIREWRSGKRQK
ncbi:bifunctional tRNA (5-methylaminomethyl-2-thiouridine)(34)-methyltransferase MnmD/FAD-dependent 5-carboxymethylaminomethyl-2-thiouridine(34) oxidoreductase MnmC [Thiomicrorhabdus sp. 6S3-12]|uniref:bifunctional tRNA (5-methylaminomethyl-2-thiouridine)(34)-methyltransferase MnmD/FAD-dependent 5-carboxymethylaminomethyl-2-thiouridine(34) oxidoreductase MnmC n=1 Tax=Thiomicrorhabdus sp. 6S3-12 TaxID=2819681 RepID=UPI001AAD9B8A|nr:bifunctional tRNA (5-methylaminomethyl-2-thiouridine)(34)-methyltransferase MnmD/FAD-dependent 5-carboxymethylaminomethyl-2-thiouridine(34) oxidoreductase MnmC [Thiomicrorhabdus sp. 6S3-12]MBO1924623.1 bifunctional tRNA (5-methylaminomethyl-2-thiouridine)(34)-methyltransferase MnmD/FAD-dependent 5-carboxymethylaminomethyl-2-thiouridine(34) oxidoreductase MnmC [Thiomicrorhabdus sp. 6S3-12]